MFPMEFDHTVLDTLPVPAEEDIQRVFHILKAIVSRRVMPYFRKNRGTDAITISQVGDSLVLQRLEDPSNRVRGVSLVTREDKKWLVHIHERIFDYLAFVIPTHPEARLGEGTPEERKVLALSEFLLRHELEHMLYPQRTERDVLEADAVFAMFRRENDPTFYRALRNALSDELNGLKGGPYSALFDSVEKGESLEPAATEIVNVYVGILDDLPENLIQAVFPMLDGEIKTKVLGLCYRRSRDTSYSLIRRTSCLEKLARLFDILLVGDAQEAHQVFDTFKDRWGIVYLLQEFGWSESMVEGKDTRQIFELFQESLARFLEETRGLFGPAPPVKEVPRTEKKAVEPPVKSLKDRIEEAKKDPEFPTQVMEVIDKNKLNAVGHSGSKFSELIETLLAIPWGKIQEIKVTPEEFEQGLDLSHYGLKKPKEIICDFFTNLIWRYDQFQEEHAGQWRRNGSAFLFVGPPGVGKTSLAISIATNLRIPYHKLSLGGMRDEADLRGHGFTYEGSKPGAIVQGLIKMGAMNGMFIMDEADKTEKFAISTLLEILDPEQNHLFHDKYTQTTVDIDLSNCHFMLTANTLDTVPPPVINRCEVVHLDRYSVEEKVAIAEEHLIGRIRERYRILEDRIFFDPGQEEDLLRHLVKNYTREAGVRELERMIRTLLLRAFRKEILTSRHFSVKITREKIKKYLEAPVLPRQINNEDRVGEMMALGINVELGIGSLIPIQATLVKSYSEDEPRHGSLSMVHATGNIEKIMDESRKVATTAILYCAEPLGIDLAKATAPVHLHFMAGSTPKDGPSGGGAVALALASVLTGRSIRRDVAMTGEIDTQGRIAGIGGLDVKLETAADAGCKTVIIPRENLTGKYGIERMSDALKEELQVLTYEQWKDDHEPFDHEKHMLQVVAVENILQAADIAMIDESEIRALEACFIPHAGAVAAALVPMRKAAGPCFNIIYAKNIGELGLDRDGDPLQESCGSVFLVRPELKAAIHKAFPDRENDLQLWEFDPSSDSLGLMLRQIDESLHGNLATLASFSLLAPYFFLINQRDQIRSIDKELRAWNLTLFANNYTAQGFKIKGSKRVLNRVYRYLSRLEPEHLEACPFLCEKDGIQVVNLSYIPEKYSLDLARAERILNAGLADWLKTVEEASRLL